MGGIHHGFESADRKAETGRHIQKGIRRRQQHRHHRRVFVGIAGDSAEKHREDHFEQCRDHAGISGIEIQPAGYEDGRRREDGQCRNAGELRA